VAVLADLPELVALGTLAGVAPSRMASAFNDAQNFFEHVSLEELDRIKGACERLGSLTTALAAAMDSYVTAAKAALPEVPSAD
jgi:hypothetical protein